MSHFDRLHDQISSALCEMYFKLVRHSWLSEHHIHISRILITVVHYSRCQQSSPNTTSGIKVKCKFPIQQRAVLSKVRAAHTELTDFALENEGK